MVVILRSRRNMIHPTKNGLMKGGSVVLDRPEFNAKEPIVETKDSKTFTESGQKVLKANRLAIPNSLHQSAVRHLPMQNRVIAFEKKDVVHKTEGGALVENKLKVPISLKKKQESKNNIKLVF